METRVCTTSARALNESAGVKRARSPVDPTGRKSLRCRSAWLGRFTKTRRLAVARRRRHYIEIRGLDHELYADFRLRRERADTDTRSRWVEGLTPKPWKHRSSIDEQGEPAIIALKAALTSQPRHTTAASDQLLSQIERPGVTD